MGTSRLKDRLTGGSDGRATGRFWEKPIEALNRQEWEALCDGCGKCCLHKLEDEDTGEFYFTNVACKLLDLNTARCGDYRNRRTYVPDCVRLTAAKVADIPWLPDSCAYRLRARGEPLPAWHYLLSGDQDTVHATGNSIVGKVISEEFAGPLEHHIVWPGEDDGDAEEAGDA